MAIHPWLPPPAWFRAHIMALNDVAAINLRSAQ
jgi:hypothetical protein